MPRLPNQRYLRLVKKIDQGHSASIELELLLEKHLGENYDSDHLAVFGATIFDTGNLPFSFEECLNEFAFDQRIR